MACACMTEMARGDGDDDIAIYEGADVVASEHTRPTLSPARYRSIRHSGFDAAKDGAHYPGQVIFIYLK